ncbi:MAG: ATP-binding protein [candidate division KSB1 bacterium]|nr:ATP-binding protein [candidate division KSB1 bacterium]MDQ7062760.1 ATP-binding protein [candidate division KSB1 bacterium]
MKIPSQTDNLEIIRDFVAKIARKVGFNEDDINKIELAVDEACTNVIKHAYDNNSKNPIDITIQIDYQKLTILVTDKGKGFDPTKLKTPDLQEYLAEMRVGGLGIYLMKNLMDEVEINSKPGKGNQVRMVKYLDKGDAPPPQAANSS